MKRFAILFTLVLLAACNNNSADKNEREGEPTIYGVDSDDPEMNKAIAEANQTLNNFKDALVSENPNYNSFSLKVPFSLPAGSKEHLWVSDVWIKNGEYYGVVGNLPESTTEVKLGDTIRIAENKISDWMYLDGMKLRGGYTIRLLRDRMGEAERKAFDAESGLLIE